MRDRNQILEEFYKRSYNDLCKRVANRAGGAYNAEDVVQEAFLRALKYWGSYNPERRSVGAWFNTILQNALKDFSKEERMIGMTVEFDEELCDGLVMSQTATHMLRKVRELIESKDGLTREILELYFLHSYKPRDIVKVLDVKVKTVDTYVFRFKQEVKEKLGE